MKWIYLSPHLDDVALSCGGLIWDQARRGDSLSVWTICAGDPPPGPLSSFAEELHLRWGTGLEAAQQRRQEDISSCKKMGADYRHFTLPDCIYRFGSDGRHFYASEQAIFGPIDPNESTLVIQLAHELAGLVDIGDSTRIVCPLSLGGHVDHRLTRAAAEQAFRRLWYYADYPYVLKEAASLERLGPPGGELSLFAISLGGQNAWKEAVAAHASQISTFWTDLEGMEAALGAYLSFLKGICLWKPPINL